MPDREPIALTRMQTGQSGRIYEIRGGFRMVDRLNALGIIPGKRITKISSMFARGPVAIEVDRGQVAIGYGMANKIIVQPDQTK